MSDIAGGDSVGDSRRGPIVVAVVILALAMAVAGGLLAGSQLATGRPTVPGDTSVDAGFAREMQTHHIQAVQMSLLVLDRSQDEDVRALARDILLTQQQQAGQMYGWLDLWGLPQHSSRPVMSWMPDATGAMSGMQHGQSPAPDGSPDAGAGMPGMATEAALEALRVSSGLEADRRYRQLMIPHHQGGVAMAQVAADRASAPEVRRLAQTMVDSQTAELTVLREMLAARGGAVGDA